MKKKTLSFMAALAIGLCFAMSCSNDFQAENDIPVESQLQILKQKFLYFADQYGVNDISFHDELLKEHLNLTDSQIEAAVLRIAAVTKDLNIDASTIRKKRRTRSAGDSEGGEKYEYTVIEGKFTDSRYIADSLHVTYTIEFYKNKIGIFGCKKSSAMVRRAHKEITSKGTKWVLDPNEYPADTHCSVTNISGSFATEVGSSCSLDVSYTIHIFKHYEGLNFSEYITSIYHGADATVVSVTTD